jgi:hypothetical protein
VPSRIETLSSISFVTARSRMPLPVKSPTATAEGPFPTGIKIGARKLPSLRPSRIDTSLVLSSGMIRSSMPLPVRSAATTSGGEVVADG